MKYILNRIITMSITLILISLLTFAAFQVLPGNPVDIILGVDADPLQVQAMTEQLGLNKPMYERFFSWVSGLFQGDLGISIRYQVPVAELIKDRLSVTLMLAVVCLIITIVVVIPVAIFLARNNNKKSGIIISAISQLGVAIPSFWLGIILSMIFSVILNILPSGDYVPFSENPLESIRCMILPALSIAIGTSAVVIRYLKNTLLDQMKLDYVRTAKSKGLSEKNVVYRHILRNAMLPVITILGMIVVDILGGSIIVENVFNIPGIGNLIITGVSNRDLPLVQSLVFYLSFIVVVINFLVDILYSVIDPRIKFK